MFRVQSRSHCGNQVSAKTVRAKARGGRAGGPIALALPLLTVSGASQIGIQPTASEPTRRIKSRFKNCEAFGGWRNV
jgi:hypothetical protein